MIGGSVGYCVYYNVFICKISLVNRMETLSAKLTFLPAKFVPKATHYIGGVMVTKLNVTSPEVIGEAIKITGASLLPALEELPGIKGVPGAYEMVVYAGQVAFAESYKYVYFVSIAFGAVSILAACFLGDISKYMDDHVAVVMH